MNIYNRKLLTVFCLSALVTACSNDPKIKSASADKVIISAPTEKFLGAYDLAKKECEKNTKTAHYIADDTADLEILAFDCVGQEEEVVAEAASEETAAEPDTEASVEIEQETPTEEAPAQ